MAGSREIEIVTNLFKAWSSGDVDAPREFLTEDAILHDVTDGEDKAGWPAIREFFGMSLRFFPDVQLVPQQFFTNDDGLALTWIMSGTVATEMYGPENKGKRFETTGMSTIEFRGDKVCREVDYHHGPAIQRSVKG